MGGCVGNHPQNGDIKVQHTTGAGFSQTAHLGNLLYIVHYANRTSNETNELLRLQQPVYPLSPPAAKHTWPVSDSSFQSNQPNLFMSQHRGLLVQFQTVNGTVSLVGLEPKSLKPLWTTPNIAFSLDIKLAGRLEDTITVGYSSKATAPYNTSIVGYSALDGHQMWQVSLNTYTRER